MTQTSARSSPIASSSPSGDSGDSDELLDKLLQATNLEQLGRYGEAKQVYSEIVALDSQGTYGLSAHRALENLPTYPETQTVDEQPAVLPTAETLSATPTEAMEIALTPRYQAIVPRQWRNWWGNLRFGTKLIILLVSAAVIPVMTATQVLVWLTQDSAQREFQAKLLSDLDVLESDYVLWSRDESRAEAENLANLVVASLTQAPSRGTNLTSAQRNYLRTIVREGTSGSDWIRPELTKSFRIVTDAEGVSIAQVAKLHRDSIPGQTEFPLLPAPQRTVSFQEFQAAGTVTGIELKSLPIVQQALKTQQPVVGVELVPWNIMSALGLGDQAAIGARTQPPANQLASLDNYRAGLVSMAVYPIQVNAQLVGVAIVGNLLNKNHALIDFYSQFYNVPRVSIYAYNWRVNTTVPFTDGRTRAVGTFAPEAVSEQVLQQGKPYSTIERVDGISYATLYRPIYDHRHTIDPTTPPIGMIAIASPRTSLERLLLRQQLLGLGIGGGMLLLVGIVAIPVANSFAFSLRNLAQFAQRVGDGETATRIETTTRTDEVGILARELNDMARNIGFSIAQIQHQEQQRRQEAEQQRREKEQLQKGVVDLLLRIEGAQQGDLTVRAPVTSGEVGSIADAFNATINSLRQIVIQVQSVTHQVNQLAQRSATSVQQFSSAARTQSAELSQALESVVGVDASIQQVAQSSQEAAAIARRAAKASQLGDLTMDQTVASMDKIRLAVANTTKQAKRLAETSQEISQILAVITWISERANLLAFNAAIAASRAGEQGQDFRQVADELRSLAQQATDSAQDIEELVGSIQQETAAVLNGMEVGTAEVVTGTQFVTETKDILQGLTHLSQQIDQYLQDVAHNTISQTQASQQMSQRMETVATIAQSNAQEAAAVMSSLEALVQEVAILEASVAQFRLESSG